MEKWRGRFGGFFAAAAMTGSHLIAQPSQFLPGVQPFVSVDAPVIALTHVRVIDGTGAPARADQTLIIDRGKIQAVGNAASLTIPAGARVLDLSNHTVIPGLVGMHEHLFYPSGGGIPTYNEQAFSFPRLYLASGVTTMRTGGSMEPYTDLNVKKQIEAGRMPGPKMDVTGPYIEGPGSFALQMPALTSPEDARRLVEYWFTLGATSFKAYTHISRAALGEAIKAAHAHNIKVTGHLCSVGFREAAALGIDDLEHGLLVDSEFVPDKKPDVCPPPASTATAIATLDVASAPVQTMIRDLVSHQVAITSTLAVFEAMAPNRPPLEQRVLEAMTPQAAISYLTARARNGENRENQALMRLQKEMQFERDFAKAGGLLIAGADPTGNGGALAGFADQRNIELLVEAGFRPVEAIQIATLNGAKYLGQADRIGSLAAGKQADVVVIAGDPAAQIQDIRKVKLVFKDGVGYDSAKLIESVRQSVGLH